MRKKEPGTDGRKDTEMFASSRCFHKQDEKGKRRRSRKVVWGITGREGSCPALQRSSSGYVALRCQSLWMHHFRNIGPC